MTSNRSSAPFYNGACGTRMDRDIYLKTTADSKTRVRPGASKRISEFDPKFYTHRIYLCRIIGSLKYDA